MRLNLAGKVMVGIGRLSSLIYEHISIWFQVRFVLKHIERYAYNKLFESNLVNVIASLLCLCLAEPTASFSSSRLALWVRACVEHHELNIGQPADDTPTSGDIPSITTLTLFNGS